MNLRHFKRLVPVILVVGLAAASAFAKSGKRVLLSQSATLNGTTIPAGNYQIAWSANTSDPTVNFVQGKRTVASVQAKWADRDTKYPSTEVLYDNGNGGRTIVEIRLGGTSRALVFEDSAS